MNKVKRRAMSALLVAVLVLGGIVADKSHCLLSIS